MLTPKRVKHRKVQRGSMKGKAKGHTELQFGSYGIQALQAAWITNRQIEAARVAMTRHMRRGGRVWITIFPDKPITKKPAETRMGSGKGNPEAWVAVVKPNRVMFEIADVDHAIAMEALRLAIQKLPIKCRILQRDASEAQPVKVELEIPVEVEAPVEVEGEASDAETGDTAGELVAVADSSDATEDSEG